MRPKKPHLHPSHEERFVRFADSCVLALARDRGALFIDPLLGGAWGPLQVARRAEDSGAVAVRVVSLLRAQAVLVGGIETSTHGEVVVATLLPHWYQRVTRLSGERIESVVLVTGDLEAIDMALKAHSGRKPP